MIRKKIKEICDNSDKFKIGKHNILKYNKLKILSFGSGFSSCILYVKNKYIELNEKEEKLIIKFFKDKYIKAEKKSEQKEKNIQNKLLNQIKF